MNKGKVRRKLDRQTGCRERVTHIIMETKFQADVDGELVSYSIFI